MISLSRKEDIRAQSAGFCFLVGPHSQVPNGEDGMKN